MRFQLHRITSVALALLLGGLPGASWSPPPHEKVVWNYDGGIFLRSEGSIPDGPCFNIFGRVTAPAFFENLKRIDTGEETIFRSGPGIVTQFPEKLHVHFTIYDGFCSDALHQTSVQPFLTRPLVASLKIRMYWKSGTKLRPIAKLLQAYYKVEPVPAMDAAFDKSLPERFEWSYTFDVPSEGVPITDSLVLMIRTSDGHLAARVAARL